MDTPEGEFFIPASKLCGAIHGDMVEVARIHVNHSNRQSFKEHRKLGNRTSARVLRVLERGVTHVVGRFEIADPFGVVVPDDPRIAHDIFTSLDGPIRPEPGQTVRVRIDTYPSRDEAAFGTVVEIIDEQVGVPLSVDRVIIENNLSTEFDAGALREASLAEVNPEQALSQGYEDLRQRFVMTIDPHDARDFDDALSIEPWVDGGWKLGVHIADVSHYVRPGTALDRDARMRATSVYLVDRVIPMLPEELSCGVCSLQEGHDRRAMTVDIHLDASLSVRSTRIFLSLIRSDKRLSYDQAQELLESPDGSLVSDTLGYLHELADGLKKKRIEQGSLDLLGKEPHVILSQDGDPLRVEIRQTTSATSLVEQAMILANTCVTSYLHKRELPCMYRNHEAPFPLSLAQVYPLVRDMGYGEGVDRDMFTSGDPFVLGQVLQQVAGHREEELVSLLILRSLKRAEYSADCKGHFALALEVYCHFTSPIRRYPDLLVHRILRDAISGQAPELTSAEVGNLAEHCSAAERVADKASSDSQRMKLVEYMSKRVGEQFFGTITRVTNYGLFITLENTATGLAVPSVNYEESFEYDGQRQMLIGEDSGRVFRLGQQVEVVLDRANLRDFTLDFSLIARV